MIGQQSPWRRPLGVRGFTLVELLVVIAVMTILAGLLLPVISQTTSSARLIECNNNLGQIYKAARTYATYFKDELPNLYAGLPVTDHVNRYRENRSASNTVTAASSGATNGAEPEPEDYLVPAGLWLLKAHGYTTGVYKSFFCPNIPGHEGYDGSSNPATDGLPQTVGYAYNYFPDDPLVSFPAPTNLTRTACGNNLSYVRHNHFLALIGDVFENSNTLPHGDLRAMNVCYWDGSVQRADLGAGGIVWNSTVGEDQVFSANYQGSIAVRDAWVLLSKKRR